MEIYYMNNKEYLTELPENFDCSSVSQLPAIDDYKQLSSESLFLISQPTYGYTQQSETETGYMSKFLKLNDLVSYLKEELKIEQKADKTQLTVDGDLQISTNPPYILSAFSVSQGIIDPTSVKTYSLEPYITHAAISAVLTSYTPLTSIQPDNREIHSDDSIINAFQKLEARIKQLEQMSMMRKTNQQTKRKD